MVLVRSSAARASPAPRWAASAALATSVSTAADRVAARARLRPPSAAFSAKASSSPRRSARMPSGPKPMSNRSWTSGLAAA